MLGMSDDSRCVKCQHKASGCHIKYQHYNKQTCDHTEQIEILHQDDITDTSGKAHPGLLRKSPEYQSADKSQDHRCMHASRSCLTAL